MPSTFDYQRVVSFVRQHLITITLAVFLLSALGTFAVTWVRNTGSSPTSQTVVSPLPSPTLDPLRPYAVALLGYGGPGHQGGTLTDTMLVARIAPRERTIHLISIPRDSWVQLPIGRGGELQGWKLNAAFAIGGDDDGYLHKPEEYTGEQGAAALAKYAMTQVTGLPIEHVVAVNFAGFVQAVDVLGGITVNVDTTFDDYWYPIAGKENETCDKTPEDIAAVTATLSGQLLEEQFPCRYEHLHFDAGPTRMDGATALKYVRSRHSSQDGNDFGRSTRQRKVLLAMRDAVFQVDFLPKAIPFLSRIAANVRTDLDLADWQQFIAEADELRQYQVYSIALSDDNVLRASKSSNGQFILLPMTASSSTAVDWSSVHAWLDAEVQRTSTSSATRP